MSNHLDYLKAGASRKSLQAGFQRTELQPTCSSLGVCSRYVEDKNWTLNPRVSFWLWGQEVDLSRMTWGVREVHSITADQKCILALKHLMLSEPTAVWLKIDEWKGFFFQILLRHESFNPWYVLEVNVGCLCHCFNVQIQVWVHGCSRIPGFICTFSDVSNCLFLQCIYLEFELDHSPLVTYFCVSSV